MAEDPQTLLGRLIADGMKQSEIVDALKKAGISVTQPTLSRIKNGARTSFEIGMGLLQLHQSRRSSGRRAATS